MVDKVTLQNVSSFQNDTSAVSTVNNNMALITTAMDNTLSRDGTSPNMMGAALDMNSNQIFNLPAPSSVNSPARLIDVASNPTIVIPGTGTSGHVVPFLDGNNTFSGTSTFTNTVTVPAQTISASQIVNNTITSSQIANNTVGNAQIRQGVARSVVGITGNATANEADIQGTTRQVLAVNAAGTALTFAQPQGDQLLGSITNDSATAGNVGEFVFGSLASGSAVSLVTTTAKTVCSISLTAGDWDVWVSPIFTGGSTTAVTYLGYSISQITNTFDGNFGNGAYIWGAAGTLFNSISNFFVPNLINRVSLSGTTTIFLVVSAGFATSTCSAFGSIQARRVR